MTDAENLLRIRRDQGDDLVICPLGIELIAASGRADPGHGVPVPRHVDNGAHAVGEARVGHRHTVGQKYGECVVDTGDDENQRLAGEGVGHGG